MPFGTVSRRGPSGRHHLDLDAERRSKALRLVDIEAREGASRRILEGEGLVVAGSADPQHARGDERSVSRAA